MTPRTWLLSGVPRSGTSLCCRLVGELPDTVALSEPIRRKAFRGMDTPRGACVRIGDFAEEVRARILGERRGPSVQVEGRLDDNRTASRHTNAGPAPTPRRVGGDRGRKAAVRRFFPADQAQCAIRGAPAAVDRILLLPCPGAQSVVGPGIVADGGFAGSPGPHPGGRGTRPRPVP